MKLAKWLVAITLVVGVSTQVEATEISTVSVLAVRNIQIIDGAVEAINQSTIKSLINAKVKAVHVDVDDFVATNTLLIELDASQIQANLDQAKAGVDIAAASLKQAKIELERLTNLRQSSYVSDSVITSAQANADKAQGQLNFYQAQVEQSTDTLTHTKIIAPYSGVVVARHIEAGETALVGSPLLTGFAVNQNRIVAHIPQRLIGFVEQNNQLLVQNNDNRWMPLPTPIIAPSADKFSHTVLVRAIVDKSLLDRRPGSFVKVGIDIGQRDITVIPRSSIVEQGDLVAVFVHQGGSHLLRQIRTGQVHGDKIEVISGLNIGEKVVKLGSQFLASKSQLNQDNK